MGTGGQGFQGGEGHKHGEGRECSMLVLVHVGRGGGRLALRGGGGHALHDGRGDGCAEVVGQDKKVL